MTRRLVAGLFVIAGVIGACVIAEPPTDLPTAPDVRPTILRQQTVPPSSAVITGWPTSFFVPVQISDPRDTIYASYFVDFNPATGGGYQNFEQSTPSPGNTSRVRRLELNIIQPTTEGCHVVEVVVARNLLGTANGRLAHTPEDPTTDGDSVTWFYSSNGDPSGCPLFDAGLAPLVDAGPDGGDGGDAGTVP